MSCVRSSRARHRERRGCAPLAVASFWELCLLEIAVDDVDQLVGGVLVKGVAMFFRIDEVGTDVFLDDLGEQAVHRAATGRDQVHDFGAPCFTLQGALDSVDLTTDTADPVQQLLLFVDRVGHWPLALYRVGGYSIMVACNV